MIRSLARRSLERALGGWFANRRILGSHRGDLLVLALHNVVPDGAPAIGDRSLHLPLATFRALLDRLAEVCRPVPLEDAHRLEPEPAPRFAITFDDAYRGALTLALPELERLGIPATVFVPTAMIGDRDFWWDAIADRSLGLSPRVRSHILEVLAGDDQAARAWARQEGLPISEMPLLWRSVSPEELRHAAGRAGVSLAPHGHRHLALDRLSKDRLMEELEEPGSWLAEQRLPFRRMLAYPYGRSSPQVRQRAREAGYESAWAVSGGWRRSNAADSWGSPRMNLPAGASVRGGMLRAAGLLPT